MGTFGIWQWVVILAIVLILFARPGRIAGIMGDFGKGLRNFRAGMKDGDDAGDGGGGVIDAGAKAGGKAKKKSARKARAKT